MNTKTSRRLIKRLGLVLAVAAIAVPAAQAVPNAQDRLVLPASSGPTDSLGRPLTPPEPTDSLGRPLTPPEPTDSLGRPLSAGIVQPASEVTSDSSGFDWTYIGIGFFALGLVSLGGAALIIGRQNRRSRLAAA